MAFEIRNARPEDCEVIRDMIFELARYERLESACKASRGKIERELFGPNPVIRCVLGWEIDEATGREEPVAFALYFFNFSTFLTKRGLYLEDLFVRPEARRRGYGRRIMHHLAKTALELDCGRFEWTVLDWNQPAIDFYEKLGARLQEDWRICRLEGEALRAAGLTNA